MRDGGAVDMKKRSITISGHATSVTLEDEFWALLKKAAAERGVAVRHLVAEIDAKAPDNLSSALRIYVVEWLQSKLELYES